MFDLVHLSNDVLDSIWMGLMLEMAEQQASKVSVYALIPSDKFVGESQDPKTKVLHLECALLAFVKTGSSQPSEGQGIEGDQCQ